MSILNYFSRVDERYPGVRLPHPDGLLTTHVPSSAITAANDQVDRVLSSSKKPSRATGAYQKLSADKKAEIGKKAAETRVSATVRYYASKIPETLKESSVRDWKMPF